MNRVTRIAATPRSTSFAHQVTVVRPFHHTSAASSPSNSIPAKEGDVDQAQTARAAQTPDSKPLSSSEKKAESSSAAKKKTVAEQDEELRLKLEGMSGDGGASGIEYEGGKAEGLKRGVKSNMFRVI